jgi:hypothetical protein
MRHSPATTTLMVSAGRGEAAEPGYDVRLIVDQYETRTGIRRPRRRLVRGRITKRAIQGPRST